MTRPLPAPLSNLPDQRTSAVPVITSPRLRSLLAWSMETTLPVVGEFLRQRLSSPRKEKPHSLPGVVHVESVHVRLLKHTDGTHEWHLEHFTMNTPRRAWHPGRWVLLLSLLAGVALAVARVGRTMRQ